MDKLLNNTREKLQEDDENREKRRLFKLHQDMAEQIKLLIIEFYNFHGDKVKKIIHMLNELKHVTDKKRFLEIEKECKSFRKLVRSFQFDEKKARLTIHEEDRWGKAFPLPEDLKVPKARQFWFDLWNFPMMINGSGKKYEDTKLYHTMKEGHNLVWAFDQEYKGREIWVDLERTICDNHGWREYYGLKHLDAISMNY